MNKYYKKVLNSASFLKKSINTPLKACLLTGTGLGDCAESIKINTVFDYREIPEFPISTVEGHNGKLILGKIGKNDIAIMQGRFHLYEGYTAKEVSFPIRVMKELGVENLIVTNASGGINKNFSPGDIMVISDHINLTGTNPLTGINEDSWGNRFPEMTRVYTEEMSDAAFCAAENINIELKKGIYAGLLGPSLETPAEIRYLKIIGADTVGFSTIPEVIAAIHGGMKVLGLSVITNINDPDNPVPATIEEVLEVAGKTAPELDKLLNEILKNI